MVVSGHMAPAPIGSGSLRHISTSRTSSRLLYPLRRFIASPQVVSPYMESGAIERDQSSLDQMALASAPPTPPDAYDSTPTETVMSTPELLLQIFSYFLPDRRYPLEVKSDRETLLRLALTNGAFNGASMPYLWSYMTSVMPALLLLPSFTKRDNQYVLGLVEKGHWAVFDRYTAHIRTLELLPPVAVKGSSQSNTVVHPAVYSFLFSQHHGLLPTIRHFIVADTATTPDLTAIAWTVSTNLETLDIGEAMVSNTGFMTPFLQAIGKSRLTTVRIRSEQAALCPEALCLLMGSDLQELELILPQTHLSGRLLARIASMTSLKKLSLHAGAPGPGVGVMSSDGMQKASPAALGPGQGKGRHKLVRFCLTGSPSRMLRVLQYMAGWTFRSVEITEESESSPQQTIEFWSAFFEGLALVAPVLDKIAIHQLSDSTSLSPAILSPLFSLSLRCLQINAPSKNRFQMTDAEFASMIGHLSHLETLELGLPRSRAVGPTFLSLVYLSQARPCSIKNLIIGLADSCLSQASLPPLNSTRPMDRCLSLEKLCIQSDGVGSSTSVVFDNVMHVAQLLYFLFPNLVDLQAFPSGAVFCSQTQKVYHALQESAVVGVVGDEKSS